jgi:hypothetical protein
VDGLFASAVLWGGVPAGSLAGAQGRLQAMEGRAEGWQRTQQQMTLPGLAFRSHDFSGLFLWIELLGLDPQLITRRSVTLWGRLIMVEPLEFLLPFPFPSLSILVDFMLPAVHFFLLFDVSFRRCPVSSFSTLICLSY